MILIDKSKLDQARYLIEIVSNEFGCDITDNCRKEHYIAARAMCFFLLRKFLHLTYQQIGFVFNKNHATVLHAVNEWPYMVKYNADLELIYSKVFNIWTGKEDVNTLLSCEDKIQHLQEQINLLTLQLAEAKKQLNQPEADGIY